MDQEKKPEEFWKPTRKSFWQIVDGLASEYARREVRTHQRWANDRGESLTRTGIENLFNSAYEFMFRQIVRSLAPENTAEPQPANPGASS